MATLIRTPVRSGVTRQLGRGGVAAVAVEKTDYRKNESREEMPAAPDVTQMVITEDAGAPAAKDHAQESLGLPRYDAETFTAMLVRANERADAAEQELEALKAALEDARAEAQAKGYADGIEKGRFVFDEELAKLRADFNGLLESMQRELTGIVENSEEALVEIAYAAVCRVIGSVAFEKDTVLGIVRAASQYILQHEEVTIHLSEHDYKLLRGVEGAALPDKAAAQYRIVADNRIKTGGCILETQTGSLDARLEVQLQCLKEAFLAARAKSMAGA